ncbi:putative homoserine/homoserine lactone efflux protein [uncultured Alphaproteobacteria bacterium]|uniref:Putative homoserine/homoserine lactone efflux protein n=1 Tax=uncultured Alphaproteobacteria bacterium TaxID=91750 RepID=A0A212JUY0_9PROT|nr:putative homoserine/homoserine lactone efflux protein [uncultured Alphaproteobacteria bacterium]
MIPTATLVAFTAAASLLSLAPGPDNLFVLTQSALKGRVAGLMATLGLCSGLVVHTTLVAFGVAAVFQTSEVAFTALKLVGAAYLAWLAWKALRAPAEAMAGAAGQPLDLKRMYLRGILMNLTNPKVAIFFLAFLPQFADPARGALAAQMFVLGGVFIVCAWVVFSAIAVAADGLSGWMRRSPRGQVFLNRAAGVVFLGLAARLAMAQR